MKLLNLIANILLIIGGVGLGLIGIAQFDLFGRILGYNVGIIRVLYALIGFAAIAKILLLTVWRNAPRK